MPLDTLIEALCASGDSEVVQPKKRSCLDARAITRAVKAALSLASGSSAHAPTSPRSTLSASGSPAARCQKLRT